MDRFVGHFKKNSWKIILRNFLADQLVGLDGLINLANIALPLAFSVRDVLKLRILPFASDVMVLVVRTSLSRAGSEAGIGLQRHDGGRLQVAFADLR
jgi:hypothetical protein